MKIVRPASIGTAQLVSTTAVESAPVYSSIVSYDAGDQVVDATGATVFESIVSSNTGNALTDATKWFEVGPANRWAMFDAVNGTSTTGETGLDVTVRPSARVDSVSVLNVDAAEVQITVTDDADGVIFDETFSMVEPSGVTDWYAYFFEPIVRKTDLVVTDIQTYASPQIRVQLSADGDPVSVGTFVAGQTKDLGGTQYGAGVGIVDYSRKTADEFGNYQLVERAFSRKLSVRLNVAAAAVDEVTRILSSYRATPILYIGSELYQSTAVFGFFREFNVEIAYTNYSFCSLEIEGLT